MDPLDNFIIEGILQTNANGIVLLKEDDRVEYKLIFDNGSKEAKAKYGKELAALYNYQGGYLIFGVDDTTNELVGLSNFVQPDNADLSNDINSYFSPAINFQSKLLTIQGKEVFVLYAPKRESIPTICIKTHQTEIKESTIYWRYSGQASPIKSGDLINLFNEVKGEENRRQTQILEKEFRAKYKPRLELRGGVTSGSDGSFYMNLHNKGEDGIIESVSRISTSHEFWFGLIKDRSLKKDQQVKVEGRSHSCHPDQLDFKLLIKYRDEEGHNYESTIHWDKGKRRIIETKEL